MEDGADAADRSPPLPKVLPRMSAVDPGGAVVEEEDTIQPVSRNGKGKASRSSTGETHTQPE